MTSRPRTRIAALFALGLRYAQGQFVLPLDQQLSKSDPLGTPCAWGKWNTCSEPCGGGQQRRERIGEGPNSLPCRETNLKSQQTRDCNTAPCRVADAGLRGHWRVDTNPAAAEENLENIVVGAMWHDGHRGFSGKRAPFRPPMDPGNLGKDAGAEGLLSHYLVHTHLPFVLEALSVLFEAAMVLCVLVAFAMRICSFFEDVRKTHRRWDKKMRAKESGRHDSDASSSSDAGDSDNEPQPRRRYVFTNKLNFFGFELQRSERLRPGEDGDERSLLAAGPGECDPESSHWRHMSRVAEEATDASTEVPMRHWSTQLYRGEHTRELGNRPAV